MSMKYQLIRLIGRGGMATVWEGRVTLRDGIPYPVAIKVPHPMRIRTEAGLQRLIREGMASLEQCEQDAARWEPPYYRLVQRCQFME